jgi:CRISPR-associated RAMP protein (TIGR02581 family)
MRIRVEIEFETAWRIGSGREGDAGSDLGVLRDADGMPLLPGSSLKGRLRGTCERLAHLLGASACMLNGTASGTRCVSDVRDEGLRDEERRLGRDRADTRTRIEWARRNTCDVCKLFGSPAMGSRLSVADGRLRKDADAPIVQVRDGVVIDRDAGSAVPHLKYDYEVTAPGAVYETDVTIDDPTERDLALLGAALVEWADGFTIGGGTSRGLGRARARVRSIGEIDLTKPEDRRRVLTARCGDERWRSVGGADPLAFLQQKILACLEQ